MIARLDILIAIRPDADQYLVVGAHFEIARQLPCMGPIIGGVLDDRPDVLPAAGQLDPRPGPII